MNPISQVMRKFKFSEGRIIIVPLHLQHFQKNDYGLFIR